MLDVHYFISQSDSERLVVNDHAKAPNGKACKNFDPLNVDRVLLVEADKLLKEVKGMLNGPELEDPVVELAHVRSRSHVLNRAMSVLSDEAPVHLLPPAVDVHILKVYVSARV